VSFLQDTHEETRRLLLLDNPKAREVEGKLNYLKCAECGKNSCYAWSDKPNVLMCNRLSKCGAKTPTKEIYPHLFINFAERYPVTSSQPNATAKAYLQSRALDTTKFEYHQEKVTVEGKVYCTVVISFNSVVFQRLIDYSGPDKNRLSAYSGKYFASQSVEMARQVYVVEGVFDALSLEQVGIASIASLSSMHNPKNCFKRGVSYVLAFDNDKAGLKAVRKIKAYLIQEEIEFSVQLPPSGKDWNDLLREGELSPSKQANTLELCAWRGCLAMASNPLDYYKILSKKEPYQVIFEFNGQTYKGETKTDKDDKPAHKVYRLLDCTLAIAYSIEDTSLEHESRIYHILKIESNREGTITLRLRGGDFSALNDFKSKLLQYRLLFFGNGIDLTLLAEYLFNKNPIKVRECQALGFDEKSDCYVFNNFLYDAAGKSHPIDKDGYYHQLKLKPFNGQNKSITHIAEIDPAKFMTDLYQAYGNKGLLALGFWVSTAFSHVIFNQYGFFPFFSMHGDPHCGKSDLTTLLNRCFFIDSEGLPMSSGNTKKGELRLMSQMANLVLAMLEGRKNGVRFDYDSILPLYNRNSLQVRAQTTNDNQIYEMSLRAGMAFVQNIEQFVSKPAKERVVSIHFSQDDLDDTYEAWKHLKTYSPEQLAGIGHYVLSHRAHFEKNINQVIEKQASFFRDNGVGIDRVAKNHAVAYAGAALLAELVKPNVHVGESLQAYTLKAAMSKIETSRSELLLADYFMQCIDGFVDLQGVKIDGDVLVVHLPTAMKATDESWSKTELLEQLRLMDGFIEVKSTRVLNHRGNPQTCWHFKVEKVGLVQG